MVGVIFDEWMPDNGYSIQGHELSGDVAEWPAPSSSSDKSLTLRLEELTHFDVSTRIEARSRNLLRLEKAKERADINHLDVHYSCLADQKQRKAVETLLHCDRREWVSFTMHGINGTTDLYTRPIPLEDLTSLFMALQSVQVLNLFSLPWVRGHGLEAILKTIPYYSNLKELRLQGWQMDQISVTSMVNALQDLHSSSSSSKKTASSLSLLSLRSCTFLGAARVFEDVVDVLASSAKQLQTLNMSYCNLRDTHILYLIQNMKEHPSMESLHIGGNDCMSSQSVQSVADWIGGGDDSETTTSCRLRDLNLRALWATYSDEGLLRRPVDLSVLFDAIRRNHSIRRLVLSENCIEDMDVHELVHAVLGRRAGYLSHLDLGDNPFTEDGALSLWRVAKSCPSMESLRFENVHVPYECAAAIKTQTAINLFGNRLRCNSKTTDTTTTAVPLTLWPHIFPCLQGHTNTNGDHHSYHDASPDLIYHFLQTTTGDVGLPLPLQLVYR